MQKNLSQTILKNKVELKLADFKTYYMSKATVIKTILYWPKHRLMDQWNRIEHPEISPSIDDQSIFNKDTMPKKKKKKKVWSLPYTLHKRVCTIMLKIFFFKS